MISEVLMSAKNKIIIDTDPGVDDAVALFFAMAEPDIDILGITTVNGNVPVDRCEENARKLCEFAWHRDIRVFKGCDCPLKRSVVNAEWVHGQDGLAGMDFVQPSYAGETQSAVDFIIETVMNATEHEVSILAIGPLTNIATAFLQEPKIIPRIRELIIMGGCFNETGPRGNTTPYAEFNMFADPHAADIVFRLGERITVIPMEVGQQVRADTAYMERLRDLTTRCATLCADMLERTAERLAAKTGKTDENETGTSLFDPCTVACLLRPALFSGRYGTVQVNTDAKNEKFGMTLFEEGTKRNCLIIRKADREAFLSMLADALAALP